MGIDFIYLSNINILVTILAHLSWKLKWAFPIACRSSSVRPSVCTLFLFRHLHNHWANFNRTWHKHHWVEGIQVCSIEGPRPFSRGDNNEIVKFYSKYLKIFFSRTNFNWTWQEASLDGGIQVCSNERPHLALRGDDRKNVKNVLKIFKILLLQNHRANFIKIWHKASLDKGDSSLFKWRTTPFSNGRS